jgi:hypothetical protein
MMYIIHRWAWGVVFLRVNAMLRKKKKGSGGKGESVSKSIMPQCSVDNKKLCARALVHEYSDSRDECRLDKYTVEKVLRRTTVYAAAAAKKFFEKSQSRAERNG